MTISKKRKLLITQLDEHLALLHKSVIAYYQKQFSSTKKPDEEIK